MPQRARRRNRFTEVVKFYDFNIAEFDLRIIFNDTQINDVGLISSFKPFEIDKKDDSNFLFKLLVDDNLQPKPKEECKLIRVIDDGNGDIRVDKLSNGGYQYIIKDISGNACCLLQANKDFSDCKCALNGITSMREWGLNTALMLIFTFAASYKQTVLIHASLVRHNGMGYAFIAKSGTGKSTHVSLWLKHIKGCDLMNDDNPIVRFIDNKSYIYGSPWSGKTPCYRNVKAPLGAITRIDRAAENSIEQLKPIVAFASLIASCSSMKWDSDIYNNICNTVSRLVESTKICTLHCLPNKEAAVLCNTALLK